MRLRSLAVLAALAAVGLLGGAVGIALADGSDRSTMFAELNGQNEIDAITLKRGAGDLDGKGGFNLTFDAGQVCFGITVANLDTPVAAHIHAGKSNENGPVVVNLSAPSGGDPGTSDGCTITTSTLEQAIMAHPGSYYVNVHTGAFPGGAVRGQLED